MQLNQQKLFFRGIIIWSLAAIFYFFDYLLNVSPAVMKPELSLAFNLSAADLGLLSSCYSWAYGIMQIPAGLLMDRFGPRKLFTNASLLCALGLILFGSANTLLLAQLGRILIGIGSSFAVVGCSKIASIWFPSNKFAFFVGLMVSIGMLGAAFGLSTVNYILKIFSWRSAMFTGSVIAIILSILMWLLIRDLPPKNLLVKNQFKPITPSKINLFVGLKKIITSSQVWVASIYAGLMFVPTLALGGLWGVPYLVEGHNLTRELAGVVVSLIFIGWMAGGPIYGIVSDYLKLRNIPMYFANIATVIITVILIYVKNISVVSIAILMFLLGFFSSGFILAFVVTKENNDPNVSGTAIGFINTMNTFFGAGIQWLIGRILDATKQPAETTIGAIQNNVNSEKIFSYLEYRTALMIIPIGLAIALIFLSRLKETHCKSLNYKDDNVAM